MSFSAPKPAYDPRDEAAFRTAAQAAIDKAYRRGESVVLWPGAYVVLRAPDGGSWRIKVSNAGVLSTELV